MSDRITSVGPRDRDIDRGNLRGFSIAANGRQTRAEMITRYRAYHQRQVEQSTAALELTDSELIVETYLGVWAQRKCEEVTE